MGDKRIIMEPKIGIGILKSLQGHEGNLTVNLNMNASIGGNGDGQIKLMEYEELVALLESMEQPRLENFVHLLYDLAIAKCKGSRYGAAKWLGVSWPTLYRRYPKKSELTNEKPEDLD